MTIRDFKNKIENINIDKKCSTHKINFNKIQIENDLLKFENGFLKSENERLNKIIKKIKKQLK